VRNSDKKNFAIEALKKLINGNVRSQSKRNVTQSKVFRLFSRWLAASWREITTGTEIPSEVKVRDVCATCRKGDGLDTGRHAFNAIAGFPGDFPLPLKSRFVESHSVPSYRQECPVRSPQTHRRVAHLDLKAGSTNFREAGGGSLKARSSRSHGSGQKLPLELHEPQIRIVQGVNQALMEGCKKLGGRI
jgi:hypothetical protein